MTGRLVGSVRVRTTAAATLVVGIALFVGSWVLVGTLHSSLQSREDAAAAAWSSELATLARTGHLPPSLSAHGDDDAAQVVAADGTRLATTRRGHDVSLDAFGAPASGTAARDVTREPSGEREVFRVHATRVTSPDGPVTVYVGMNTETVRDPIATLRLVLLVGVPLAVALVALVTWRAVGRALRPVEEVRAEVAGITDAELDRRVPVPPGRDEIAQLAATMNAMLDRLETARTRQRAFTADASHELQSPLARTRTQLEVALAARTGDPSTDWPALARELLDGTVEMEALVRDLLFLAAEDESGTVLSSAEVDLDDVVLDEVARVRATARVPVDATGVSAAPVRGSRDHLARLVRNLLENAVRHAGSGVRVSLSAGRDGVRLVVADDGPGIPAAERARVFDRFVRLDAARASGGTGLGLAIAAAIVRRHGGEVSVQDAAGGGTALVVLLPVEHSVRGPAPTPGGRRGRAARVAADPQEGTEEQADDARQLRVRRVVVDDLPDEGRQRGERADGDGDAGDQRVDVHAGQSGQPPA